MKAQAPKRDDGTVRKALTIAGSDSGGGAGIQADLKTFQELGVYGMSAVTAVTAQNTLGVRAVYPMTSDAVAAQLGAVGDDLAPDAVKTGMLVGAPIIDAVADQIASFGWRNLVIDPVMIAKGGSELLRQDALRSLKERLLPLARVITPNIPEAETLTGMKIATMADREKAARLLAAMGAGSVAIKGGHDESTRDVTVDLLYEDGRFRYWESPRVDTRHTHGTGCTYSAALAAGLAAGLNVPEAAELAKSFIRAAIEDSLDIGSGHGPTNHWAYGRRARGWITPNPYTN
ncbi:bifunctional hydroxymethylpyrimidine kinase/phosphomethylpyrimidine kinase [Paenibacillus sp. PAMC21692]|uniref:bifunctional hydroxymethylpyrimidine kinase/phosphomethylpyrimidine kinase n=1 Tax=Paenibacillus sp. PAMC21692 TaxID=2762320 RepID=UPI00164DBE4B|nr:bifunctional hydroxymethylpyrimidine kinase/phosphomethylpyrimidine kinase [Paenibacillus sp. PAMC21692]QNK59048.1 bifunctional hydroxymethylpyrimidine kinase/phosphomethylpyrimidine kinase [Paenibacillus sp. PAMC21692]